MKQRVAPDECRENAAHRHRPDIQVPADSGRKHTQRGPVQEQHESQHKGERHYDVVHVRRRVFGICGHRRQIILPFRLDVPLHSQSTGRSVSVLLPHRLVNAIFKHVESRHGARSYSRKNDCSIPRPPALIRNRSPAQGSWTAKAWVRAVLAEVTYNSSRFAPPNAQLVGYVTGNLISRSSRPAGLYLATLAPPHRALHKQPSRSTAKPSGTPSPSGTCINTRRFAIALEDASKSYAKMTRRRVSV